MKVTDFKAATETEKNKLKEQLHSFKLEKVQSLWYFVAGKESHVIIGSKGE